LATAVDTDGHVDTVEATCPHVLEQLEDELLTVSTARLLRGKNKIVFERRRKEEGKTPNAKPTSISVYGPDIYDWLQHEKFSG